MLGAFGQAVRYPQLEERVVIAGLGRAPRTCAAPAPEYERLLVDVCVTRPAAVGPQVATPADGVRAVKTLLGHLTDESVEWFYMLIVDARHRVIGIHETHKGGLSFSLVDSHAVVQPIAAIGGAAAIIVHNHPSGDPTPSRDDFVVTKRVQGAIEAIGARLLDHVIVAAGTGQTYSFLENGRLGP